MKIEMKNIEKTFLVQIVNKDEFRNTVISGITSSNLMNDIVLTDKKGPEVTKKLLEMHKLFMDHVKEEYKENPQIFPAPENSSLMTSAASNSGDSKLYDSTSIGVRVAANPGIISKDKMNTAICTFFL